jgi:hypothetical protein
MKKEELKGMIREELLREGNFDPKMYRYNRPSNDVIRRYFGLVDAGQLANLKKGAMSIMQSIIDDGGDETDAINFLIQRLFTYAKLIK